MLQTDTFLKKTIGRCLVCQTMSPATVFKRGESPTKVLLESHCPEHGDRERVISSDARFWYLSSGNPLNACCGSSCSPVGEGGHDGTVGSNAHPGENRGLFDGLSSCVCLIEIVKSCNLTCPTCYAASIGSPKVDAVPLDDLKRRIQGVIDRKGEIEILQLSGGEPTLHPEFFELLEWARKHPKIQYVLINTNGLKIAADAEFARRLGEMFRTYDNFQLYLQFDGVQMDGQRELRGGDFRNARQKVIERCGEFNLPITLAMTVIPQNLPHLWETVSFGLRYKHVRAVSFQPAFTSGRTPMTEADARLNTADIILGLVAQSGLLQYADFTSLPCGDPNCASIGWLFRMGDKHYSPTAEGVDLPALQALVPDRINYRLEDLAKCGCDGTALGAFIKTMELEEANAFRILIKPFMDAWSWDQDRIDRCCTHVITETGALDSFCRYYSVGPGQTSRDLKPRIDLAKLA